MNKSSKQIIQILKHLQSLITHSRFKVGTHIDLDVDRQRLKVRRQSRWCLYWIQNESDEQVNSVFFNQEYGRVMPISFSTARGFGEEQYRQIYNGLYRISVFLEELHEGRNNNCYPSFQPLPVFARRSEEQIEEEGENDELDAQMNNNGVD
ncbi:MAG: hypothetical protein EZS28_053015, partial [Streblomastix strix]